MAKDFIAELKKHKNLVTPDMLKYAEDNLDLIPEEVQERILNQLSNTIHLQNMIAEYDEQRMTALQETTDQLNDIEREYIQTYKNVNQEIEKEDQEKAMVAAEKALKDIK